ncbi:MAG TPA: glutamate synthase subunit beta [Candidatus Brocadiia bacterium]|nr:glutamate synthase subunit beta [Candidatus Brocadiia bacterium]
MGKPEGFMLYQREAPPKRPVEERIKDCREVEQPLPPHRLETQAARCMDCGVPYCHMYGCPLRNYIPDFNDMVYRAQWRKALDLLHMTNNFPEITGRVCPAPCEAACTLSVNQEPVTIKQIELQIVERGWEQGWITPQPAPMKTGKKVAIIGSGPTGLAAAQQLARSGHGVTVFEKSDRIGGILRYGIPDFKLDKRIIDRRLAQMRDEGVVFEADVDIGVDISARHIERTFDAILIAAGSRKPRDLEIPGRELAGIHFAMPFLIQQNLRVSGVEPKGEQILATGKRVVVIGGGDTGADCVGTARRQGAREITQIEVLPKPPDRRPADNPWPTWPQTLRSSSSHEEGCARMWSGMTKEFVGCNGAVSSLKCVNIEWSSPDATGRRNFREIPGSEFELEAEMALLAMGFVHVEHGPMVQGFGLKTDARGNIVVDSGFMTSNQGIFAAGDAVMGASLVVRAIFQGREAAAAIDKYLAR